MSEFVTLSCPSCGAKLQIGKDIDRFACAHCGNEHIVRRSAGVVSLAPVVDGLREIRVGVDKTGSELAIPRLQGEIQHLYGQKDLLESGARTKVHSGIGLIVCAVGSALVGQLFAFTSSGRACWGIAVVLFLLGIVLIVLGRRPTEAIRPIDQEIAEKEEELAEHERIVSLSGERQHPQ